MNTPPDGLSVVIPVYNSQSTLAILLERLEAVLPGLAPHFELLLVNDGSRDASWEEITRLSARYPWLRGLCLMRNFGQHNALLCGIRAARYPVIVTLDDDLQTPPEEIPALLAKLAEGFDVVYGTPRQEQHGLWRDLASQRNQAGLAVGYGRRNGPARLGLPRFPHPPAPGFCQLPLPLRFH